MATPWMAKLNATRKFFRIAMLLMALLTGWSSVQAQEREEQGKPIGKASVLGDVILVELDQGALGEQNLFDLTGRTLRFTPRKGGYRIENVPVRWDAEFGPELSGHEATLHNLSFPFLEKAGTHFPWVRQARFDSVRRTIGGREASVSVAARIKEAFP